MIDIDKAFEGRWRIKADSHSEAWIKGVKELCRDFFETGVLLGEGFTVAEDEQCGTVIYKHDPVIDTDDNGFSEWWDMYGKKIDRAKCEKKWEKLSFAEKQACIAATPAYVASTPDLQFRRHPMTYLNNKSWENQIIPRNNGTDKPTIDQQRTDKLASILTE
jgi:hypothetical protein